MILCNNKK